MFIDETWTADTLLFNFLGSVPFGLSMGALVTITPNAFRGQLVAPYLCCISVTGFGIGSIAVGLLNDRAGADRRAIGHSPALIAEIIVPAAATVLPLSIRLFAGRMRRREAGIRSAIGGRRRRRERPCYISRDPATDSLSDAAAGGA